MIYSLSRPIKSILCLDGLVVSMYACHLEVRVLAPWSVIPKTIIKIVQTASLLGKLALKSLAVQSAVTGEGSVCLWGLALYISPVINSKSRVLYNSPGFLSSATWCLMPKKALEWNNHKRCRILAFCLNASILLQVLFFSYSTESL